MNPLELTTNHLPNAQVGQVTETINNAMQASSAQIVQVMAVLVGIAVLIVLWALIMVERARDKAHQQDYDLLRLQVDNNTKTVVELKNQTHTLNDMEYHLSSMHEDIHENLEVNKARAAVHDENKANIDKLLTQQALNHAELLTKVTELVVSVTKALDRDPYLSKEEVRRWERKLDLIIERAVMKEERS